MWHDNLSQQSEAYMKIAFPPNVKHKFCPRAKFAYLDVLDGKLAGEIGGLAQVTGTISDTRFKVVPLANNYVTITFDASNLAALADISELIYFELS